MKETLTITIGSEGTVFGTAECDTAKAGETVQALIDAAAAFDEITITFKDA